MNKREKFRPAAGRLAVAATLAGLLLSAPDTAARAQQPEPSTVPVLRIEAGMHTARINKIAVDRAERYLITASSDKTVRVWDRATGRLLRVLRPPVGENNEGEIYAVAVSPGGMVACGGWTGQAWDKTFALYLFDANSGVLERRISGLPNVVHALAFSHDGRFLAATLGDRSGVRVFRTGDGALAAQDDGYGDASYGADFDPSGRLVTASLDGFVRLYDRDFRRIARQAAPEGGQPQSVRFSPDGSRVAVGAANAPQVDVLNGKTLAPLYAPDTSGVTNGNLAQVAWSGNGCLYAAGQYQKSGAVQIRRWTRQGQGDYADLPAARATVLDLAGRKNGGVAFGTADPAFGVYDASDRRTLFQDATIADFGGAPSALRVSRNGETVSLGGVYGGAAAARFSVRERVLTPANEGNGGAAPNGDNLRAPITTGRDGLVVRDWDYSRAPKLNNARLPLKRNEVSRCLAIAPDGQSFVIGTEWYLRRFDRHGNETWSVPAPGVIWAANVSGDNKFVVAACGDGTVRWFRARDGQALLVFFPHHDRERWIAYTPQSGYYDVSPGGEDLIGWHVNRGKNRAGDFFPASRFRTARYRPAVVAAVLQAGDEAQALRVAAGASDSAPPPPASLTPVLPPVVRIVAPADGDAVSLPQITLRYALRAPSGAPITGVKALVNGRPAALARRLIPVPSGAADTGVTGQITVVIPPADCEIALIAENEHAASVPATIRLQWRGGALANRADTALTRPRLYVLAVGVADYADPTLALRFAAKDARDFAQALQAQARPAGAANDGLYREIVVRSLVDRAATRQAVLDGLAWIQKQTTRSDVAMVFLSGHGANDPAGTYYFLPADFRRDHWKDTGVPFSAIKNTLEALTGKALFFVDSCHSGDVLGRPARTAAATRPLLAAAPLPLPFLGTGVGAAPELLRAVVATGGASAGAVDVTAVVNELASAENGAVVFAASTGRQVALEDPAWRNGAFTRALVEGLGGLADGNRTGRITTNMLDLYISERVKALTNGAQTPTTTKPQTVPDFPIALGRR